MGLDLIISDPLLQSWINDEHLDQDRLEQYRKEFQEGSPFPHLFIDNLVKEEKLSAVIDELSEQEFEHKSSDLFSLAQTLDFDNLEAPILLKFKDLFRSSGFQQLMEYITSLPLSEDVDCLGNIYQLSDHLLCHDDELLKRKIAYILYLTDLYEEDGGALNLFNTKNGKPLEIVKTIQPRYNRFTFFKVTRTSFHEVSEVLQEDIYRVSISGWFNND